MNQRGGSAKRKRRPNSRRISGSAGRDAASLKGRPFSAPKGYHQAPPMHENQNVYQMAAPPES